MDEQILYGYSWTTNHHLIPSTMAKCSATLIVSKMFLPSSLLRENPPLIWKANYPDMGRYGTTQKAYPTFYPSIEWLPNIKCSLIVWMEISSMYLYKATRFADLSSAPRVIYYSDIKDETATVLVNTVVYNQSKFSPRDYFKALDAKKLHSNIALPSHWSMQNIVTSCRL